jgi:Arm DNA-binding domain
LVPVSGAKLWRLAYRFNGKQKSFALGKNPEVSLLAARRSRDDARRLLLSGIDPSAHPKAARRKRSIAAANTFEAIANVWFQVNKGRWVDIGQLRADIPFLERLGEELTRPVLPRGVRFFSFAGVFGHAST